MRIITGDTLVDAKPDYPARYQPSRPGFRVFSSANFLPSSIQLLLLKHSLPLRLQYAAICPQVTPGAEQARRQTQRAGCPFDITSSNFKTLHPSFFTFLFGPSAYCVACFFVLCTRGLRAVATCHNEPHCTGSLAVPNGFSRTMFSLPKVIWYTVYAFFSYRMAIQGFKIPVLMEILSAVSDTEPKKNKEDHCKRLQ